MRTVRVPSFTNPPPLPPLLLHRRFPVCTISISLVSLTARSTRHTKRGRGRGSPEEKKIRRAKRAQTPPVTKTARRGFLAFLSVFAVARALFYRITSSLFAPAGGLDASVQGRNAIRREWLPPTSPLSPARLILALVPHERGVEANNELESDKCTRKRLHVAQRFIDKRSIAITLPHLDKTVDSGHCFSAHEHTKHKLRHVSRHAARE